MARRAAERFGNPPSQVPMMEDLRAALQRIEADLEGGTYRPGPWDSFLRKAGRSPRRERMVLAADVSRVSDELHLRNGRATLGLVPAIALELGATILGALLLVIGLRLESNLAMIASGIVLATAVQPLLKMAVGHPLGIRYSYAYLLGIEPRFKMRYGTYLAAEPWQRVVLHLGGTIGSPLALFMVGSLARVRLPLAAWVSMALFWVVLAMQVIPFLAGMLGVRRLGPIQVRQTSGGAAAAELREARRRHRHTDAGHLADRTS
jgi:hypothetical protein